VSEDTDWVTRYDDDPGDDSGGPSRPPIWVVAVVVLAVVTGGWMLVTQRSTDDDPVTSPPFPPATTNETSAVATTTAPVVTSTTASPTAGVPVSGVGNPPATVTTDTPDRLAGYVAVTSPRSLGDPTFNQDTVWVFQPGGSLVSTANNGIGRLNAEYPMLITAGHLLFDGHLNNGWIIDTDVVDSATPFGTNRLLIPGAEAGLVWFWLRSNSAPYYLWVSPVDVESRTVGERVDITNLFDHPVVGVADGLIVVPDNDEKYGRFAYWSPADGLAALSLPSFLDNVVAASGDLVVVATTGIGRVSVLNIVTSEQVGSFMADFTVPVTSACLSPGGQHVIVVGSNGEAVVGNVTTGDVIDLNAVNAEFLIQPGHGIGWTTDDQLVFIGEGEFGKKIVGFDVATDESFDIAALEGSDDWWLTASGTMC
jgi:hypothetical protein